MRTRSSIFLPATSSSFIPLPDFCPYNRIHFLFQCSLLHFLILQQTHFPCIDTCVNMYVCLQCIHECVFELYSQVRHSPHIVGSRMAYPLPIIHPVNFIAFTSQDARMPAAISALPGTMLDLYWVKRAMLLLPVSTHTHTQTHTNTYAHLYKARHALIYMCILLLH